jgi:hypothetical protein
VTQNLAPTELAELEQPQSYRNSVVWLSNLLDPIHVAVDGLEPRRVRKYGELSPDETDLLGAIHGELFGAIQTARASLDLLTQNGNAPADTGEKHRK